MITERITSPTLLLNEEIARRNIRTMVEKTRNLGLELVPHFKTHQSAAIGSWFAGAGIRHINVSSVAMARYFADAGWEHITIAFPFNLREAAQVADLATRVCLSVLVTDERQVAVLADRVEVLTQVYIEIDAGGGRSGLSLQDTAGITTLIERLQGSQHRFAGFYSHFGHTYGGRGAAAVQAVYRQAIRLLEQLQRQYAWARPQLAVGDTPSASLVDEPGAVDSWHAGNFVFYDLMQVDIGSCREEDIAVALACPVVNKNPGRHELVVYGGAVHLGKDSLTNEQGRVVYGKPASLTAAGWSASWPDCYVKSLSQEHGVIQVTPAYFNRIRVGELLAVLPVHSCLTADSMGGYLTLSGQYIDHLKPGWMTRF